MNKNKDIWLLVSAWNNELISAHTSKAKAERAKEDFLKDSKCIPIGDPLIIVNLKNIK